PRSSRFSSAAVTMASQPPLYDRARSQKRAQPLWKERGPQPSILAPRDTRENVMSKKVHLVVIDPQVDFCDPNGALYVQGAEADIRRLAAAVKRLAPRLDDIHVTLDSHRLIDVAHPVFWKDSNGAHPAPFTIITAADVEGGRWTPVLPGLYRRM